MGGEHAIGPARPHHGDLFHVGPGPTAAFEQDHTKCLVGQYPGEVVDAAVALGLADHGNDVVGGEGARIDQARHAGGARPALEDPLMDDVGHHPSCQPAALSMGGRSATRGASPETSTSLRAEDPTGATTSRPICSPASREARANRILMPALSM